MSVSLGFSPGVQRFSTVTGVDTMDTVHTSFDLAAEIALGALRPEEREQVLAALHQLGADPSGIQGSPSIRKVGGSPGLHVLRVGERLRVLFSIEPDQSVAVRDIVSQGMVEAFRRQAAG
jgi:hypothetical protein